jgi:hypothetical protein
LRIAACAQLLLLTTLTATSFGAEVYRSKAADGTVSYSDRPQGDNPEFVYIATPRAARSAQPAQQGAPAAQGAQGAQAAGAQAPIMAEAGPTPEQVAEMRAKNCTIARERLVKYSQAHRLYRPLENGERAYLTDDEIDDARAKAEADVEEWCS